MLFRSLSFFVKVQSVFFFVFSCQMGLLLKKVSLCVSHYCKAIIWKKNHFSATVIQRAKDQYSNFLCIVTVRRTVNIYFQSGTKFTIFSNKCETNYALISTH